MSKWIIEFDVWNDCGKNVLSKLEKNQTVKYTYLFKVRNC